jgi:hypothetical protein
MSGDAARQRFEKRDERQSIIRGRGGIRGCVIFQQPRGRIRGNAIFPPPVVAIIGVLILLHTKSRRAHMLSVISAGLPILVGASGFLVGYLTTRNMMHDKFASDPSAMRQWRFELASPTFVGATIALPLLVLLGILFAFRTRHLDGKRPI